MVLPAPSPPSNETKSNDVHPIALRFRIDHILRPFEAARKETAATLPTRNGGAII